MNFRRWRRQKAFPECAGFWLPLAPSNLYVKETCIGIEKSSPLYCLLCLGFLTVRKKAGICAMSLSRYEIAMLHGWKNSLLCTSCDCAHQLESSYINLSKSVSRVTMGWENPMIAPKVCFSISLLHNYYFWQFTRKAWEWVQYLMLTNLIW